MKVLNLYAGIGGNRKLWQDVEVTAVELNPKIAEIYQDLFPDDTVVVGDAHQYLLDHFKEFDFIWSSPPCPTHSKLNFFLQNTKHKRDLKYPDMKLYQEIIVLGQWFDGLYCVENVVSYYDPLIKPIELGRHYYWSNFYITPLKESNRPTIKGGTVSDAETVKQLQEYLGFDLSKYGPIKYKKGKLSLLRNAVYPPDGKHILECARGKTQLGLTAFSKSLRINDKIDQ